MPVLENVLAHLGSDVEWVAGFGFIFPAQHALITDGFELANDADRMLLTPVAELKVIAAVMARPGWRR